LFPARGRDLSSCDRGENLEDGRFAEFRVAAAKREGPLYQQPTAPQIIGRVLDAGFDLFRRCLPKVYVLAAVASLMTAPLNLFLRYSLENSPPTFAFIPTFFSALIVIALLVMAVNGAIIARIDSVARAAPLPIRASLAIGFRRLPATIVSTIAFAIGAVLLMIPGLIVVAALFPSAAGLDAGGVLTIFLVVIVLMLGPVSVYAVWLVFAPSAVIIERFGPIRSLTYSATIVRGHWWRTAALLTMLGILFIALYALVGVVAGIVVAASPSVLVAGQMPWYFDFIVGPLVSSVAVPLMYSLLLSIYYDLKTRLEGGDLAARIAASA